MIKLPKPISLFLFLLISISSFSAFAQNAPTYVDWVKSGQTYFQIKIGKDGIYRLTPDLLGTYFQNLGTLNAAGFQLLRRGKEQAILVNTGTDNILNGNDYIEFIGLINDNKLELEMFQKPLPVYNEYRSIYEDTAHYFLTYSPALDGKRVINNGLNNVSSVPFEPYAWRTVSKFNRNQYANGAGLFGDQTWASYFTAGEGWTGEAYSADLAAANKEGSVTAASYTQLTGINNLFSGGPKPFYELMMTGRNILEHDISLYMSSLVIQVDTFSFKGRKNYKYQKAIEPNLIENGTLSAWPKAVLKANISVNYALLKYPATLQMPNGLSNLIFELAINTGNYSRLKFDNLASQPDLYDITDPLNPIRIGVGFVNGAYISGVENTASPRTLCIQNQAITISSSLVSKCSFTNFNPVQYNYLLISHPKLRLPSGGYSDPVDAYASYRASPEGGSYKVLTMMMDEVYQRFGYGDRTPLAIRNIGGYFIQNQAELKCMFLIGKGITVNYRFSNIYAKNSIPTFGSPASDNAFALGLGQTDRSVLFPVGRLAAQTPAHVVSYLNKVKETEAFQYDDLWKKNAFLISGGTDGLQQSAFTNITDNILKPKLTDRYMGAKVGIYNKSSTVAVQPVSMRNVLNAGISMLTLFGHSSAISPDVEIGYVSDPVQGINNAGKYPMVIINGCFSGSFYDNTATLNEDWILTPNKGAVLFLSSTHEGFSAFLQRHIGFYYDKAYRDSAMFGETAGKIQQEAMRKYMSTLSSIPQLDSSFMHQFTLHGDPMVRIFGAKLPDYKTSNGEVYIATPNASASSANLKIGVIASNFGRFTGDSLEIGIKRRFSDGSSTVYRYMVKPVAYKDTFFIDLPQNQSFTYSGTTRIEVILDLQNMETELNENNNSGVIEVFIPSSGIIPLFPKNYSIVNNRNVTITVQSTDLLASNRRYIFELDTSASFNSGQGAHLQSPVIIAGNICTWKPLLPFDKDSTVFFWRVKFADASGPSDTAWYTQSFEYIKNSITGWSQTHFYQFKGSDDYGVVKDYVQRKWNFPMLSRFFDVTVSGGSRQGPMLWNFTMDGVSYLESSESTSNCVNNHAVRLCAIHIDRCTLLPQVWWNYFNAPDQPYLSSCGRPPSNVTMFEFYKFNTAGNTKMQLFFQRYINEKIPVGDYVVLFPIDSIPIDSFRKYAVSVLPLIGVNTDSLAGLQSGNPFIIFGQRTALPSPGLGTLVLPQNIPVSRNRQTIKLQKTITSACASGSITSTRIGPASKWFKLFNRMGNIELPPKDKYRLQLIGIQLNGKDSVLLESITQYPFDLAGINADTFPYLKIRIFLEDTTYNTPATIKRWMVTYDGVPEGILNTSVFGTSEYKVSNVQEGDSLGFRFAFSNISPKPFRDSVVVQFSMNGQLVGSKNLGLIPPDSTVKFSFDKFSTIGKPDNNQLLTYVNPKLQPEEYYENNALNVPFTVIKDKINPVLDVTFDGVKIMNGDFVSTKPLISITMKDENKYLLKKDTVGTTILLTKPCQGCQAERIPLNSPNVKVYPAGKDNMFRLEYKPEKLENGAYRLAVQGTDVKGNESGTRSYEVDFKVLDQNTITNFYPYPNPFSTSCQWVFTLTGEFPDDFKIQIMTVTGKVVREITKAEIGPLRIGNNISSYRWNATDEFGDRLANGVYLYRVVMKEGSTFVHRATEGDNTFTKGFGKLYIIR